MKEALEYLLKAYRLDDKIEETNMVNSWEAVMGPMIAKHTTQVFLNHKKLYVVLDSPGLRNELLLAKSKIIKMLNDNANKEVVKELIFQ